jgi:hypothetical protein
MMHVVQANRARAKHMKHETFTNIVVKKTTWEKDEDEGFKAFLCLAVVAAMLYDDKMPRGNLSHSSSFV